jgi:acetyl esterase/lipase
MKLLLPFLIYFQKFLWKTGEILACFYGPMAILAFVLFFLIGSKFLMALGLVFTLQFLIKWKLIGGNPILCLTWPQNFFSGLKPDQIIPLQHENAQLYLNSNPQSPCLLFLFGGGFISGSPDQLSYLNLTWKKMGFHVLQVPYDLAPKFSLDSSLEILKSDIENLLNFKTPGFNPSHWVLAGRSAGAYMAYSVSTQLESEYIKAVWGFYPPTNPQAWNKEFFPKILLPMNLLFKSFFKNQTTELNLTLVQSYDRKRKYFLATGDHDVMVSSEHSKHLAKHLRSIGISVELFNFPTEPHGFEANPHSFAGQKVLLLMGQKLLTI